MKRPYEKPKIIKSIPVDIPKLPLAMGTHHCIAILTAYGFEHISIEIER